MNAQGPASHGWGAPKPLKLPLKTQPLSPTNPAPLMIPISSAPSPRLAANQSKGEETPGLGLSQKSVKMLDFAPCIKSSVTKQSQVPTTVPSAIATSIFSTKSLPRQLNYTHSRWTSSQPWSATLNSAPYPLEHPQTPDIGYVPSHRRGTSESANSVIDRGRHKKNSDASPSKRLTSAAITISVSEKRKAFEALPPSSTPAIASRSMSTDEIEVLKRQAMGQATRFGVLKSKDVNILSWVHCPNLSIHIANC